MKNSLQITTLLKWRVTTTLKTSQCKEDLKPLESYQHSEENNHYSEE